MGCPQCQSDEIDSSGICLVCGYQIPAHTSASEPKSDEIEGRNLSGAIEINYSEGSQETLAKEELPQWRKDLSQRLQAIKQKRDKTEISGAQTDKASFSPASQAQVDVPPIPVPARPVERTPVRKHAPKPAAPVPRQQVLQPLEHEPAVVKPAPKTVNPEEIQKLIDHAVARQSSAAAAPTPVAEIPSPAEALQEPLPELFEEDEGKLILLSRTLSGLVDLIIVMVCTGGFIIAADFFSGIIELDAVSYLDFSVLLLLMYFVYSIFFLTTCSQTIGMMITDLRVVGVDKMRPSLRQLLSRCFWYLISLLGLGFGLFWSLFDRESMCFHDRSSDTQVIRL